MFEILFLPKKGFILYFMICGWDKSLRDGCVFEQGVDDWVEGGEGNHGDEKGHYGRDHISDLSEGRVQDDA